MPALSNNKCSKCLHEKQDHFIMIPYPPGFVVKSYAETTAFARRGFSQMYCCVGIDPIYLIQGEPDDERFLDLCPCQEFISGEKP